MNIFDYDTTRFTNIKVNPDKWIICKSYQIIQAINPVAYEKILYTHIPGNAFPSTIFIGETGP